MSFPGDLALAARHSDYRDPTVTNRVILSVQNKTLKKFSLTPS